MASEAAAFRLYYAGSSYFHVTGFMNLYYSTSDGGKI